MKLKLVRADLSSNYPFERWLQSTNGSISSNDDNVTYFGFSISTCFRQKHEQSRWNFPTLVLPSSAFANTKLNLSEKSFGNFLEGKDPGRTESVDLIVVTEFAVFLSFSSPSRPAHDCDIFINHLRDRHTILRQMVKMRMMLQFFGWFMMRRLMELSRRVDVDTTSRQTNINWLIPQRRRESSSPAAFPWNLPETKIKNSQAQ